MSAQIILTPRAAADLACHDEQLCIWAHDVLTAIGMCGEWLRDDMSSQDQIELEQLLCREIRKSVKAAFDHPEVRSIRVNR